MGKISRSYRCNIKKCQGVIVMPIYEYQCNKCGYIFEEVTLKIDPTKISTACPVCAKNDEKGIARRILSKGSFVVNGFNSNNGYSGNMRGK